MFALFSHCVHTCCHNNKSIPKDILAEHSIRQVLSVVIKIKANVLKNAR